jgi:hypothetical protein
LGLARRPAGVEQPCQLVLVDVGEWTLGGIGEQRLVPDSEIEHVLDAAREVRDLDIREQDPHARIL